MSDLIDRQAAIDAINSHFGFSIEEEYGSAVQEVINSLPSALGTNLAEVGTDLINRQATIDAITDELDKIDHVPQWVFDRLEKRIRQLPSAQPEPLKIDLSGYSEEDWERLKKEWANTPITVLSAQPKKGRWISADAMFHGVPFYCSECGENTRDTVMGKPRWKFCPMCGSRNEVTT